MPSLSKSTLSKRKQSQHSARTTQQSTMFKSIGRQTKPSWGNRLYKDTNDLSYHVKYSLIKGKSEFDQKPRNFFINTRKKSLQNNQSSLDSKKRPLSSSNIKSGQRANQRLELMKMNKNSFPQKYDIFEEKQYSTLETHGLGKHEFEKTIEGKIKHKQNRHLFFENQTQRTKNINPTWYNPEIEINFSKMQKNIDRHKINCCHGFESYTTRKVFEPKKQLDKFYNTKKAEMKCKPKKIKQIVEMQKISGRVEEKLPLGATLAYKQDQSRSKIEKRSISYEISRSARVIEFSPEVVWKQRGCKR